MRLKDKVAIVTGAASGNGEAIAKAFLNEGAKVVFADINEKALGKLAGDSDARGADILTAKVDVSDQESVKKLVDETVRTFGKVDIMVANAGVNSKKSFLEITEAEFDFMMNINTKGVFFCSQEAAKVMKGSGGSIIHMSSITSSVAEPDAVHYGASKGAVGSMTRHMALDLGQYDIRVNAIAPGTIKTNLTAARLEQMDVEAQEAKLTMLNRIGRTDDLTGAAILLASEESSFMTGTHLYIDGGYTVM